ncbi:MAG: hypothetical protein ABH873_03930 [Candidatus Firestonebacteria bacterium]
MDMEETGKLERTSMPHFSGSRFISDRVGLDAYSIILIFILLIGTLEAKGLKVSPAGYVWKDVKIGEKVEMPIKIEVMNDSKKTRCYALKVKRASEINVKLEEGFKDIPRKEWISFEKEIISVLGENVEKISAYINVPRRKGSYDRRWQFYIEIKEKTEGGEMFGLACYMKILIQTIDYKE